jgi:hypothetical protein
MRHVLRNLLAVVAIWSLISLPVHAHAQRAASQIVGSYMTTYEAFNAFNSDNSDAPPKVTAYPEGVAYVGFYFHYRGMKPKKDTFRVGFTYNGGEVRHGTVHTFDSDAGQEVLAIPADNIHLFGPYKATLYIDNAATKSVSFKVIVTPKITEAYMITAKAWEAFGPNSKNDPSPTVTFAAGVARVGAFFSYTGMVKADVHSVAVYNSATGNQVHRSDDTTAQYVPDGAIAIILPADAGAYPKGKYRTDLYIDNAMVKSITWTAK